MAPVDIRPFDPRTRMGQRCFPKPAVPTRPQPDWRVRKPATRLSHSLVDLNAGRPHAFVVAGTRQQGPGREAPAVCRGGGSVGASPSPATAHRNPLVGGGGSQYRPPWSRISRPHGRRGQPGRAPIAVRFAFARCGLARFVGSWIWRTRAGGPSRRV